MKPFRRWVFRFAFVFVAVLVMLAGGTTSQAQTFRGSILGTVTDSTGAAVVGAHVTVHNVDTGVDRSTDTTTDGSYLIDVYKRQDLLRSS